VTPYKEAAEVLSNSLGLTTAAVAVCLSDCLPDGVPEFDRRAPAGCRFWQEGMHSSFATSSKDHSLCAIGVYTHNLEPNAVQQTDLADAMNIFTSLGYVRDEDLPLIPVLKDRPKYVIYAPLAETLLAADVVLLFVRPKQILILSEATQQVEGRMPPALGRPACAIIAQVKNSGCAALSLGCCGASAYLDILTDNVAIFAIPGQKLELYTKRIATLAKANAILSEFHSLRRRDIDNGLTPTIKASLAALQELS
jgi:uncharacterized protein (DUF169 family)